MVPVTIWRTGAPLRARRAASFSGTRSPTKAATRKRGRSPVGQNGIRAFRRNQVKGKRPPGRRGRRRRKPPDGHEGRRRTQLGRTGQETEETNRGGKENHRHSGQDLHDRRQNWHGSVND